MIIAIYFDSPAIVTPATLKTFAILGGLDLEHPHVTARGDVKYLVKKPSTLSHADLLAVANDLAQHFGVAPCQAHYLDDFSQIAKAMSQTADAIAATFGVPGAGMGLNLPQDFDPKSASKDDLLYGLLHWSFDGNNMANMEVLN